MSEILEIENTGYLEQPPAPTDFFLGAAIDALNVRFTNASANWTAYNSPREKQVSKYFDRMACTNFSATRSLEMQLNFLKAHGFLSVATIKKCEEYGYLDENGWFNISARFSAKTSGTTRMGNYFVNVWDAFRKFGFVGEKDWPDRFDMDWDEYYAPIPQAILDKGKLALELFDIAYAWAVAGGNATPAQYNAWLRRAPIQIAIPVCSPYDEKVPYCDRKDSHAVVLQAMVGDDKLISDSYDPYDKLLIGYPTKSALQGIIQERVIEDVIDPAYGRRFSGQVLIDVDDRGAAWFVDRNGVRAKISINAAENEETLQAIREGRISKSGITGSNIKKIAKA